MNMNKLNLSNLRNDNNDQPMHEEDKKPEIVKPMGLGGKFSLDLSKAQKHKNQDDNGQDSQRELIEH